MKRALTPDSGVPSQMPDAAVKLIREPAAVEPPKLVPSPDSHVGAESLPKYLTVSCLLSGSLGVCFAALLLLAGFGFSIVDPSVWITLLLGSAGVFATSILRIRDLRAHAV